MHTFGTSFFHNYWYTIHMYYNHQQYNINALRILLKIIIFCWIDINDTLWNNIEIFKINNDGVTHVLPRYSYGSLLGNNKGADASRDEVHQQRKSYIVCVTWQQFQHLLHMTSVPTRAAHDISSNTCKTRNIVLPSSGTQYFTQRLQFLMVGRRFGYAESRSVHV